MLLGLNHKLETRDTRHLSQRPLLYNTCVMAVGCLPTTCNNECCSPELTVLFLCVWLPAVVLTVGVSNSYYKRLTVVCLEGNLTQVPSSEL